ncbi:MAG TPA: hypothetical protein VFL17_20085, partial [Anaerolineae bacterium]|nr:hypothetical protein [Anaerolineae bacterium]
TGQVYTLLQPGDGWFAFLPTNEAAQVDAPPDRHAPGEHFQRAWASLTERWRSLGWGVAPEQPYSLTLQFSFSPYGGMSDDLYLSWPDGRIAHLYVYLGTHHAGGPAWNFVDPNTAPAPAADASPVPTPFPTVAAKVPAILGFTVDPVNAKPGDRVTLSWTSTGGVTATLFEPVCCASNGGSLARDVPPNGSLTLTLDAAVERDTLTYILSVSDGEPSASKSIQIRLPCPDTYFFRPGTNDLECPSGPAVISPAAEQVFERGRMIWIESQDKVYVLLGDGQPNAPGVPPDEFSEFEDTWQPGQPESDPALSPPVALFQPLRGFGKVWRSVEWVRDGLGWALAPEQAFNAVFQRPWQTCLRQNVDGSIESCSGPNDAVQYLRAVDGRLIRMAGFGALGRHSVAQWEFWSPQGR